MKRIFLLLIVSLALSRCEKDIPLTELEKLPPATQIGARTVGCLLDGKVFLPGNYNNSTNCFYQYVVDNYNPNGGYYFNIGFSRKDSNYNLYSLDIGTSGKQIFEGQTYKLLEPVNGNASGSFLYFMKTGDTIHGHPIYTMNFPDGDLVYETTEYGPFYTSQTHTGELKITKLDPVNYIVSGTFWFDVEDSNGVVHQIREGRFDYPYTN